MAHIHRHETPTGDLIDLTYFCGDWCHRQWCADTGNVYDGWDGCHELHTVERCAHCQEETN